MLRLQGLSIDFVHDGQVVRALDDVSLQIAAGETMAVVGESGSGKSVMAMALTKLLPAPPAFYRAGQIWLDDLALLELSERQMSNVRGSEIAYVFQEPATSLNPVFSVAFQLGEAIRRHRPEVSDLRAEEMFWLDEVGIRNPAKHLHSYPHQLSGGMQQRVMIAMALASRPRLLVADEPTTALDVTVQKQILDLFARLQKKFGMAILLITHNFGIVRGIAHQVAVLYRGRLVESGSCHEILSRPQHPYTRALIECVPRMGSRQPRMRTIDQTF